MEEQVRLIFNVLEFEEVVDLLCWSIYEDMGALPLKNISYDEEILKEKLLELVRKYHKKEKIP